MITVLSSQLDQLITTTFKTEIEGQEKDMVNRLKSLVLNKKVVKFKWQEKYINQIILSGHQLITDKFSELEKIKPVFDKIVHYKTMNHKRHKKFRERLLKDMGYDDYRSTLYPRFFSVLGIKACVYCNSQLTVSVDAETYNSKKKLATNTVKAKFQVDHHIAKSDYPCFSISYYNLYPACATCNNIKRTNAVTFKLYNETAKPIPSVYKFTLKTGCQAKYELSLDPKDIEFIFNDPDKPGTDYTPGSLTDTFDIRGIYETQIDLVEEIILKARIYNDAYKATLLKEFPNLFTKSSLSDRVLLGTYADEEDIHKRPMTKFIQDVAKSLTKI